MFIKRFCAALVFCLAGHANSEIQMAIHEGRYGFVVTDFRYAVAPEDASTTGACPNGLSQNITGPYKDDPNWQKKPEETGQQFSRRIIGQSFALNTTSDGKSLCVHPELATADAAFPYVEKNDVAVEGIDLDQFPEAVEMTKHCAQDDFVGGVDNAFYRAVGCIPSWQSTGQSNGFVITMYTGSWGILITLDGVDDLLNDEDITLGIYANADPIVLSADRNALPYATYAQDQDSRFRSETKARIVQGKVISEPINLRFHDEVNTLRLERVIENARVIFDINPASDNVTLSGYMAGYTSIDDSYNVKFGYRDAKKGNGEPADFSLMMRSATGSAFVNNYTCHGVYQTMQKVADASFNPDTQRCEMLSTQYYFEAIPAFVVDVATESLNEALEKVEKYDGA